ncbi:coiled-coil domain-containing protein [Sporosarcina obsidiansis]|uniref:chromosome segregation protein SMC n=1 Tax=Sporosarcina obsidiansis TaxID=2660748 RepID=UPI00129A8E61|nr:chromosome segregation protein SMC [Sporosarcina obsidiansis]
MIPWRLRFSGIRDYDAEEMILENADEHILITGPNGAGKSTISFCMGAVLRSSKVEIEGLKSQNLPEEETWRAAIHFLFKNEGVSRIDGPLFIEFRLICEQPPKQPIKLRYEIHDGDEIEELELRQMYRSGDVNKNNFTAYRRELQFKYKIHPDLYYLIWYQQEVNQFSVMAPEERFRIFSEMHGIDRIQKDWETSLEIVKEAREAYVVATSQQKQHELHLSIARNQRDRFLDNQKRLVDNGILYALTTYELQLGAEKERKEIEQYIEEREFELEDVAEKERQFSLALEQKNEQIQQVKKQQKEKEKLLEQSTAEVGVIEESFTEVEREVDTLQNELSELQDAYSKLPYSEIETQNRLIVAKDQVENLEKQEIELKNQATNAGNLIEKNQQKQSTLVAAIEQWKENSKNHQDMITRYLSSHQLEQDLAVLEESLQERKQLLDKNTSELCLLKDELSMLQRNQIESVRQREAIRHLKEQTIRAYPLRHFVKLMDQIPIEKERFFDAIKYTIFYEASNCQPVNDLYHVSLKKLIPDRAIMELPRLGLKMQEGLSHQEQNHATRVLWWIEQFFITEQPAIQKGWLVDRQGIRGPQEKHTYILSKQALKERRDFLVQQIETLQKDMDTLAQQLADDNEIYRVWNADVQKVREAEAFLSSKADQQYRMDQLVQLQTEQLQLKGQKKEYEQEAEEIWKKKYIEKETSSVLLEYLAVYKQFGQQTKKIERLQHQQQQMKILKQELTALRRIISKHQDELDDLQNTLRDLQRKSSELEHQIETSRSTKMQIAKQHSEKEEEHITLSNYAAQQKQELDELKQIVPELVEKAMAQEREQDSQIDLRYRQNQAKVEFQNARNEKDIDPNAVENFRTLEEEFQRKQEELHSAKNLLEENEERAIQNEHRLETAIEMQVQKINLLFQQYMGEFQFEGQIKFEKLMDKKGRPIFKLFIYVRKEGHRGKFEDVSLKARGGRVGKGVSGGEESLSSLLFALSLLQNLENQAGFIVLDEFDSALDETRKASVFELYANKLQRKLIILSPKAHDNEYYNQFSKAFIISHDPKEMKSKVRGVQIGQS